MIGSIWLKEIDEALIIAIQEAVQLNINGVISPITVIPRYPDKDLLEMSLPCASIYNYDQKANNIHNKGEQLISKDLVTKKAVITNSPNRYFLYYQIDFWSRFQQDMNEMTAKWLTKTGIFDTLTVVDDLGVARKVSISQIGQYKNLDSSNAQDGRLFRRAYSYKIGAELWSNTDIKTPTLTNEIIINKNRR